MQCQDSGMRAVPMGLEDRMNEMHNVLPDVRDSQRVTLTLAPSGAGVNAARHFPYVCAANRYTPRQHSWSGIELPISPCDLHDTIKMRLSEGVHAFRGYFMTALLRVCTRRITRNFRLTRAHSGLTNSRLMPHQSHPRERSCFL